MDILIKSVFFSFCSIYIFLRVHDYKTNYKEKILHSFFIFVISIVYAYSRTKFDIGIVLGLYIFIQTIYFKIFYKKEFYYTVLGVCVSNSISIVNLVVATISGYIIFRLFNIDNTIIKVIITFLIQLMITINIFKIKRFSRGLYFLKNRKVNEFLEVLFIILSIIFMVIYCFIGMYNVDNGKQIFITCILFSLYLIVISYKCITIAYKQKIIEQTLKDYEAQIKEKDEKLKKLEDEKYKISKLNHEFYNRQKALMLKVEDALSNMNYESGEDNNLKEKIQELSNEYTNKALENSGGSNLPKTDVEEIDDMFTYMNTECKKYGIEFILKISGNINFLVNNYIDKTKLVTLIGDHLRDAIIAVNCSKNRYKSILAIIGIKDDNYEFCVYDSGIEFEIETLEKLGIEPATTHKDCGGSGIGFMTTFETLKETNASFILEELNECKEDSYTKAIRFIFDGKEMSKINSYRSNLLKKVLKTDRYEINNI